MKKFMMFLFLLLAIPAAMFAQDPTQPPAGWLDILSDPAKWFASFTAVSFLTSFLAAFFNGLLKLEKGFFKQLCAWLVAIILLVVSDMVNFGYAKDFPIILAVVHGFAAGLASNGWFDIPWWKAVLDKVEGWFHKPDPALPVQ